MEDSIRARYDSTIYDGGALPLAHPAHLATVAKLFGMAPPAPAKSRVLELGCGTATNLIALAKSMPDASFLGIDLSPVQIARGRRTAAEQCLGNIELRVQSITDFTAAEGLYDFIICHGVFSWVPELVRQCILRICSEKLSPHGVAYVSYNAYPGRRSADVARDLMLHHVARFESLDEKARQARAILEFAARQAGRDSAYGATLAEEVEIVRSLPDYVLVHDYLAEVNQPFLFREFVDLATRAGLQFLGESQVGAMIASFFGREVSDAMRRVAKDVIDLEQYLDFLRNRRFRETLLCHADVGLNRGLNIERMQDMFVGAALRACVEGSVPLDETLVAFEGPRLLCGPGTTQLSTRNPLSKAAFLMLGETSPGTMQFEDLRSAAWHWLAARGITVARDGVAERRLAADILDGFVLGIVGMSIAPRFS